MSWPTVGLFRTYCNVKEHQKIGTSYSGNPKKNKIEICLKFPPSVSSEVNSSRVWI
jgi:hypothetical protein